MMMENWQAVDPADDLHLTTSIDTMAKDYNGDEIASNDSELATLEGRQRASAERAYNASLHRMPRHHGSGGTSSKSMRRPFAEESQSQSQNDRPSSSVLMKKAPGAAEKLAEGKVFFDAETSLKIKVCRLAFRYCLRYAITADDSTGSTDARIRSWYDCFIKSSSSFSLALTLLFPQVSNFLGFILENHSLLR